MSISSAQLRRIAARYASALFSLAGEKQQIDGVKNDLDAIDGALDRDAAFRRLVESPVLSRGAKEEGIKAVLANLNASALTMQFFRTLAANRRMDVAPFIAREFHRLVEESRNESTAEVTSAHPLSVEQLAALREALKKATGRADIRIVTKEHPEILGGVVISVDGKMFDNSIATKISRLASSLKAGVHMQ